MFTLNRIIGVAFAALLAIALLQAFGVLPDIGLPYRARSDPPAP